MSIEGTTTTPVLFIVGTAGAGKSTLVTSFQRWSQYISVDSLSVNLDPGAEKVAYDPEFDVRDIIQLSDVMNEYELGPNGAQILAADLLASQVEDIEAELSGLAGDILLIDTPGQVELFAFREASNHLVEVLGGGRAALIFLFDPMLSQTPSGFVSQMLLSSIVHFRLGLPTANFLSKSDLLEPDALKKILDWGEYPDLLEEALFEEAGGERTEFAIGQLRMLRLGDIKPGLIPISSENEEGMADILTFAESTFGGMSDIKDGFAGDLDFEKDDWDGESW